MKRLSDEQYLTVRNLTVLTVITDALPHMMALDDGVIDEAELKRISAQLWRWRMRYHEIISGEDKREK